MSFPILPMARKILNKYQGHLKDDEILPVLSNQKMNAYLKEIAEICGIEKNLTFHLARHTFATTMTLGKGVPIESVSKMLGHTKYPDHSNLRTYNQRENKPRHGKSRGQTKLTTAEIMELKQGKALPPKQISDKSGKTYNVVLQVSADHKDMM